MSLNYLLTKILTLNILFRYKLRVRLSNDHKQHLNNTQNENRTNCHWICFALVQVLYWPVRILAAVLRRAKVYKIAYRCWRMNLSKWQYWEPPPGSASRGTHWRMLPVCAELDQGLKGRPDQDARGEWTMRGVISGHNVVECWVVVASDLSQTGRKWNRVHSPVSSLFIDWPGYEG